MKISELLNWCLAACEAQQWYFNKSRCTNSHEYCCYESSADLIEYFLKRKVEGLNWMRESDLNELESLIAADERFTEFTNANQGA